MPCFLNFVPVLSRPETEKRSNELLVNLLDRLLLRRPDSNRRPLGYEPNELPTAPLRDVISFLRVQRYCLFLNWPNILMAFCVFMPVFTLGNNPKRLFPDGYGSLRMEKGR